MTIVLDKRGFQDNPFWGHTWEDKRIPVLQDSRTFAGGSASPNSVTQRQTSSHQQKQKEERHQHMRRQRYEYTLKNPTHNTGMPYPGRDFRLWAQEDIGHHIQDTWEWQLVACQSVLHALEAGDAPKGNI